MKTKVIKSLVKSMITCAVLMFVIVYHDFKDYIVLQAEEIEELTYTFDGGTYTYEIDSYGILTITGYEGTSAKVTVPSEINGMIVHSINENVFAGNTIIEEVVLSDGLGVCPSFEGCTSLVSVDIPESVYTVYGFKDCSSLKNVTIPTNSDVDSIGEEMFSGCSSLESIIIPDNIKAVGHHVFKDCTSLTSVTIPSSITNIYYGMFEGCTSLKEVVLHDGITVIDQEAFSGCISLESIVMPSGLKEIGFLAFYNCTGLASVELNSQLTIMGNEAFRSCTNLTDLIIPEGVAEISEFAFLDCESLETVYIPNSVETIGTAAFDGTAIESVTLKNPDIELMVTSFGVYSKDREDFVVIGQKGSTAEMYAKNNCCIFKSIDDEYTKDYSNVVGCYDVCVANYDSYVNYLNEFYIEKNPDLGLDIMMGDEGDREKFVEISKNIIAESPDVSAPIAIYNWMNDNISTGRQFGHPMDVYNHRQADCMGNALLLCELLRSAEIPAVVAIGYTGDMKTIVNEKMLINYELVSHAWVLAYYDGQWMLLDSAMDRVYYNKEDICSWYYMQKVDNNMMVYNPMYNFYVGSSQVGICYKDGIYQSLSYYQLYEECNGSYIEVITPESVSYSFKELNRLWYLDSGEQAVAQLCNEGLVNYCDLSVMYYANNLGMLTNSVKRIDDVLYYFNQNGYAFNVSSLEDKYHMMMGYLVVEPGTTFSVVPAYSELVESKHTSWTSTDGRLIKVNTDGTLTVVADLSGVEKSNCGISTACTLVSDDGWHRISIGIDDFATEMYVEDAEIKVNQTYQLKLTADAEPKSFLFRWNSSDTNLVTVNQDGIITAYDEPGVATITAYATDGSGLNTSCKVIVTDDSVNIIEDENNQNIYIQYEDAVIDEEIYLSTKPIETGDEAYEEIKPAEDIEFVAYDINLKDKDNNKVQPNGKVKVRIPCPEGFNGDKCGVYYVSIEGKFYDMKPEYSGGYLIFETDHFSTYMVTQNKLSDENVENGAPVDTPNTGEPIIPPTPDDPVTPPAEVPAPNVDVSYHTHIQTLGDSQGTKKNGEMAGTSGMAKRLENIWIDIEGNDNLGIQYSTHCQTYGWMPWSCDGEANGTSKESKRLEAIKIQLTGADKDKYDVYYRVHAQSYGWLGWAKNGEPSGTAGYGKRLEGIQVVVVKKGEAAPGLKYAGIDGSSSKYGKQAYVAKTNGAITIPGNANAPNVMYKTHVQTFGWQKWMVNGQMSGTSGKSKRLEGINIKLSNAPYDGDIVYTTHVQKYGWKDGKPDADKSTWKKNGEMSGTNGEAKRLEAICIDLTGEMAEHYDVYYRVHAQTFGWLGWAKNGEESGTAGYAKRLEGIQIVLVPKGGAAPADNYGGITSKDARPFIEKK